jgi:SagB-type dehydrogenase family enzyme
MKSPPGVLGFHPPLRVGRGWWLMPDFAVKLHDEITTDYVLDTGLVLEGSRETDDSFLDDEPAPISDSTRPVLAYGLRLYVDPDHAVHLITPLSEPTIERRLGNLRVRRRKREIVVSGNTQPLWELVRLMDGSRTVSEIETLSSDSLAVTTLLKYLAMADAINISNRPIAQFIHRATKKGVLPGGGLDVTEVLELVTDGNYRAYPTSRKIQLGYSVPADLEAFYALSRRRRSYRDYKGVSIREALFESLLHTACGITGSASWSGRQIHLRAYPSSGGLYSVEIYPVVFAVEGLSSGVYHYRPIEHILEEIRPQPDKEAFLGAALPEEREMLAGVSAMICLTAFFGRHEHKYGEGGYRMMVAEAGHISQNLILAATALGIDARPFGGVFDSVLNDLLGLSCDEEFLLSVILGYAGAIHRPDN